MKFLRNKKIIIIFSGLAAVFFFSRLVFAVWDGLPYDPGETLNPECLPTDVDCDVASPLTAANISDTAYGVAWDTDATHAPSKNSVYDKIEALNIIPTAITVADAVDPTAYVALFESAIGDLGPKTDAGLTYAADTGILTATGFSGPLTGNVTGNASGTAATVTGAAQAAITSLGTLTTLTVDDITINGNTISSAGASTLAITPTAGQVITFDGTVTLDAGVIAGATSITSTTFVGALTGNADTVTTNANLTGPITSVGNATSVAAQTGTGSTFVMDTSPTLVTPALGVATGTSLDLGGTTLLASRALTVDTGGVFDINLGTASGDDFTIDTSAFVVEGDTGNVGIGESSPNFDLVVGSGTTTGVNAQTKIIATDAADARLAAVVSSKAAILTTEGTYAALLGYDYGGGAAINLSLQRAGGNVGIGDDTSPSAHLQIDGNMSAAAWTTDGIAFDVNAATYTDTSTAAAGTVATRTANSFGAPTFASTNAITVSDAFTLYVPKPIAGTNTTITRANSAYFEGNVAIGTTDLDGTPAIGRLTVKGSTNDGTTNILVGRDSDEANVFTIDTNGAMTSTSLDLGGTTLLASRAITVDTGGGLDINLSTASGDDFTIDTSAFVVEGDTGKIGIGTATPGSRIFVDSAIDEVLLSLEISSSQADGSGAGTNVLELRRSSGAVTGYFNIREATGRTSLRLARGSANNCNVGDIMLGPSNQADSGILFYDSSYQVCNNGVNSITANQTDVNFGNDVFIDGNADEVQLTVQGHSTQTSNLQIWENSSGTDLSVISGLGYLGLGIDTPTAHLQIDGNMSAAAWTTDGIAFDVNAATYTDTSTAAAGTVTVRTANSFGAPTFASTNAITVTDAFTLYVPKTVAGTNTTITRANSAYFEGNVGIGTTTPAYLLDVAGAARLGSGTEAARITTDGNFKVGGTATRATTEGTKHIDIFDGTAPIGTLANGISIYSSAGEGFIMDAGGTGTQQTPHDDDRFWVFNSFDAATDEKVWIDVEKLLRFTNDYFGLDYVDGYMARVALEQPVFETFPALKDIHLSLEGVAGLSIPEENSPAESFVSAFFDNLFAKVSEWLADAGNGIAKIFTQEIHTELICVGDTCLTETELQALLESSGISNPKPTPELSEPTGEETPTPEDVGAEPTPEEIIEEPAPEIIPELVDPEGSLKPEGQDPEPTPEPEVIPEPEPIPEPMSEPEPEVVSEPTP